MKKVLYILAQLTDVDLDFLIQAGQKVACPPGTVLIQEGQPVDAISIILEGRAEVSTGGKVVATLSSGEIIGELSFLDSRPPAATVTVAGTASVLNIPRHLLTSKLESDPKFASRFYRALGIFLADRLRGTLDRLGYDGGKPLDSTREYADEIDLDVLDGVVLAGKRFEWMLSRLRGG